MKNNDHVKTIVELRAEIERLRALRSNALTGRFTASSIAKLTKRGQHGDGKGSQLYIDVGRSGSKSWLFRWKDRITGKDRNISLGPVHTVSIDQAREKALHYRQMLLEGKDPRAEHDAAKLDILIARRLVKTVYEVTNEWYEKKIKLKKPAYRDKIFNQLNRYIYPTIGSMPIQKVDTHTILNQVGIKGGATLRELWGQETSRVDEPLRKNATANDLLMYLRRIFAGCPACLLNIAKRSLPKLILLLRGVGLASQN